jgi:hypothetical protein
MTVTVTIRNEMSSNEDVSVHIQSPTSERSIIIRPGQLTSQEIRPEDEIALFSRPRIMK